MAEAEASFMKRGVQNRLDHVDQCRLHDSVSHGGNSQRPLLRTARFGNPGPTHQGGTVTVLAKLLVQSVEFLPFVFGEVFDRLPVDSRGTLLAQHFTGRAEEVQLAKHLIDQRVPFSSSHFVFQKCRQHAICPNRSMSPLVNARCLSSRSSRERHCDRDVVPSSRTGLLRFCDLVISHLPPCSPSLHRVLLHGFLATTRALTSVGPHHPTLPISPCSLPAGGRYSPAGLGHWSSSVPRC